MSYIGKTTISGSGAGTINTDVIFNGKVYQTNNNYFNLQYGDATSLGKLKPNWSQGYSNTAIGMNTSPQLTTGYSNTVIGSYAMNKNTTGYQNTALGSSALYNNNGGIFNVAVGNDAMLQSYNGSYNTCVGKGCMFGGGGTPSNLTFSNNTGMGNTALNSLTSGNDNVALGAGAGTVIDTGSRNTFIGTNANACVISPGGAGHSYNQSTAIGYGATATASNQIMLGTNTETVVCPNSLQTQSIVINNTTQINGFLSGSYSPVSNGTATVSFGVTFASVPKVMVTLGYRSSSTNASIFTGTITTTNFQYSVLNTSNANVESLWQCNWIAIG